uniref:Uncharacterized protein n=1 Tax=Trichuris muris TaxID=70415 RepID=A0A5S6Q899_TRIMR
MAQWQSNSAGPPWAPAPQEQPKRRPRGRRLGQLKAPRSIIFRRRPPFESEKLDFQQRVRPPISELWPLAAGERLFRMLNGAATHPGPRDLNGASTLWRALPPSIGRAQCSYVGKVGELLSSMICRQEIKCNNQRTLAVTVLLRSGQPVPRNGAKPSQCVEHALRVESRSSLNLDGSIIGNRTRTRLETFRTKRTPTEGASKVTNVAGESCHFPKAGYRGSMGANGRQWHQAREYALLRRLSVGYVDCTDQLSVIQGQVERLGRRHSAVSKTGYAWKLPTLRLPTFKSSTFEMSVPHRDRHFAYVPGGGACLGFPSAVRLACILVARAREQGLPASEATSKWTTCPEAAEDRGLGYQR